MNMCGFGTYRRSTGWVAWIRLYHHGKEVVLQDRGNEILHATDREAEAAAKAEFFRQMNSPIVAESYTGQPIHAQSDADAHFNLKPFVKQHGSTRLTKVTARRIPA